MNQRELVQKLTVVRKATIEIQHENMLVGELRKREVDWKIVKTSEDKIIDKLAQVQKIIDEIWTVIRQEDDQ